MAAAITNVTKQGNLGAVRDYWVKITESDGTALQNGTAATTLLYYVLNPLGMDVVITEALLNITTEDDDDIDMDIGLADSATGTNKGVEICDSAVNTATGVFRLMTPEALACTTSAPVWKASNGLGTAVDSFITFYQTGASTHAVLVFTLLLRCIPTADLV